ncbi:MAG: hypothetical protein WA632_09955 [Gallionella sp.]
MQELLNNPAVQSGIAPFFAAIVVTELFHRIRLSGLAVVAGFAVTVYLASDFNMAPLTSARKIVLLGVSAAFLGLLVDVFRLNVAKSVLPVLGGIAALWTAQRILQNQDTVHMLLWGSGCMTYVAILVWGMDRTLGQGSQRTGSAATALGFGTGVAALVGASALLGQFGLALGSAAFAHLLLQILTNKNIPTGRVLTFPLSLIAGLTACIAVLSARLPWYALIALSGVPLVASFALVPGRSVRTQGVVLLLMTLAVSAVAVYLTWRSAGDIPL